MRPSSCCLNTHFNEISKRLKGELSFRCTTQHHQYYKIKNLGAVYTFYIILYDINHFPPRPTKTCPFIILLCLLLDDFTRQGRASRWKANLKTYY